MQLRPRPRREALGDSSASRWAWSPRRSAIGVFRIINSQMADLSASRRSSRATTRASACSSPTAAPGRRTPPSTATSIGSKAILVLADSTAFSAEGMLTCDITAHRARSRAQSCTPFGARTSRRDDRALRDAGVARARTSSRARASAGEDVALARTLGVRYRQQVHARRGRGGRRRARRARAGERVARALRASATASCTARARCSAAAAIEVELHRVVGTRAIEPVRFAPASWATPTPRRALTGERAGVLRARRLPLHAASTTATRCARATSSTARRSSSGWATASSSRPATEAARRRLPHAAARRRRGAAESPPMPHRRGAASETSTRHLRGDPPPPVGDQRRPGADGRARCPARPSSTRATTSTRRS